jgi:protein-L-isoaspartate(D-aspartate) O-methyltransferase
MDPGAPSPKPPSGPAGGPDDAAPFERQAERDEMVESQLAAPLDPREPVLDPRVLQAMRRVPRHRFVPSELQDLAYSDQPLSIGSEQTISQPYMVAKMTELLELPAPREDRRPRVLEVGTGSGYQAAVLAELGAEVITIEKDPGLAASAAARLKELELPVEARVGDGYRGAPDRAPFDAILVTAAPDHVPAPLLEQLAEGGRLVLPVGRPGGPQELRRIVRRGGQTYEDRLFEVRFVPMTGESERSG